MRMVILTEQRPVADATMFWPTCEHLPRTNHVRRPETLVDTRDSSGVVDPDIRVAVFHVRRNAGAAEELLAATTVDAHNIAATHVATHRRLMQRRVVRRRRMIRMTSIRIAQATRTNLRAPSYVALMNDHLSDANANAASVHGIVVISVTRDHAEVWSLDERQIGPIAVVVRPDERRDHRHVRTGQFGHGHESDEGFDGFYSDIAAVVADAGEIMIAGHGTGRANAMESLAEFLQGKRPAVYAKVSELRYVDIPHTTGRQLAALAREWKRQQRIVGHGNAGSSGD